MSNATVSPAVELTVAPKLIADVKAFVSWDVKVQGQKAEKLKTLLESVRSEVRRGVTKKALTAALREAGMDAGLTSNLISQASPVSTEAEQELQAAREHNAKLGDSKTGLKIGFHEQTKLAKGETTVAELVEKKQAAKQSGAHADRKASNTSTPKPPALKPLTIEEGTTKISAVISTMLKDGITLDAIEEAVGVLIEEYREKAEKSAATATAKAAA